MRRGTHPLSLGEHTRKHAHKVFGALMQRRGMPASCCS
jgi:hypothetical protein